MSGAGVMGVRGGPSNQQINSKNANKQFMNTSFDASKSANTINYVNSAYMSAITTNHMTASSGQSSGVATGSSKLSKVGLKQHGSVQNSRQPNNMHHVQPGSNYTDGGNAGVFLGQGGRQAGVGSHSQGPAIGGSSHKTLYMS